LTAGSFQNGVPAPDIIAVSVKASLVFNEISTIIIRNTPTASKTKRGTMLEYLTLILACQLLGEFAVSAAGLPFPGPVAGMLLLFTFLMIRGSVPDDLATVAGSLLNHLSLLFVPAGVGVMAHFELLGTDALPLSIALIVSTVLTIMVTATAMTMINRYQRGNTTGSNSQ
jgi:holin-like protein